MRLWSWLENGITAVVKKTRLSIKPSTSQDRPHRCIICGEKVWGGIVENFLCEEHTE